MGVIKIYYEIFYIYLNTKVPVARVNLEETAKAIVRDQSTYYRKLYYDRIEEFVR